MSRRRAVPLLLLGLLGVPGSAAAQQPAVESVGTRALGMAGAFVAVADDATAVYWNPAGLATAGPIGLTIGWTRLRSGNQNAPPAVGATGQSSNFTSLGTLPLGIFYGHSKSTVVTSESAGTTSFQTLETSELGATILQSVVKDVVLGSSLKYVRGGLSAGQSTALTAGEAVDQGLNLTGSKSGAFDLDLGLMVNMERVRLGITARNLRQPQFADNAGNVIRLKRESRAGISVMPRHGLTLAMDVDLDTVDLRGGLRRMIALGGESRLNGRVTVRGGVRWNLRLDGGIRRPEAATGASVRIRSSLWLEGFYTQGRFDGDRGFGFGLRAGS